MADKYVKSTGSATSPYDTWAKAATSIKVAVEAAAAGERVFVSSAHVDTIAVDTTITTAAAGVQVISTSDTATEPPATYAIGAMIDGSATSSVDIRIRGGSWFGFTFKDGTSSSLVAFSDVDDTTTAIEDCSIIQGGTTATANVTVGISGSTGNCVLMSRNCSFTWGGTGQGFVSHRIWRDIGSDFCAGATVPLVLFEVVGAGVFEFQGGDFSDIAGTLFPATGGTAYTAAFIGCKLHASVTPLDTLTLDGSGEVLMLDCASGDQHYHFRHYDFRGSTTISTAIFVNTSEGAKYDGTTAHTFVVTGNANASFGFPYVSPWIDVYHSATSAITPRLEILRDGSTTAYTDGEVWAEWLAKTTSGSTRYTLANDRRGPLATAASQADGIGLTNWTGEAGSAKSMKCDSGSSFTPAEIGYMRARVCIGTAATVYVNPKILGLS